MLQFINTAASVRSSASVTKALPFLNTRPDTAGRIAKARGVDDQCVISWSFVSVLLLFADGWMKSSWKLLPSRLVKLRMLLRLRGRDDESGR